MRLQAAAARGGPAHRAGRGAPALPAPGGPRDRSVCEPRRLRPPDAGLDTYDANLALGYSEDGRDYTVAAQMLGALGLDRVALLSNNPDKAAQLDRLGVTVAERVPTAVHLNATNARYLATKAGRGARWTSRAMTCSTPRRRARTARRLLSCHLGRTSRSWWCTVTDRWPAAASARRRLAYDGAWARSSGRCSHAAASQPVNHAAARAA